MNLDLSGKRAIVCGASAGIGKACAHELAALGASVTVVARSADKLAAVVAELPRPRAQSHDALTVDLADPAAARSAAQAWIAAHATCHILVLNTGGPAPGRAIDTPADAFRHGFESLLATPHELVRAFVPGMRRDGYGRIIIIGSTSVKQPIQGLAVSNAVRAATANWAKTLSQELGSDGITVNNVLPGYTRTERLGAIFRARAEKSGTTIEQAEAAAIADIPAARFGEASEIAAAVGFLASPAASYVNGVNLPVDGGRLGTL